MLNKHLMWKFLPTSILLVAGTLLVATWYYTSQMHDMYMELTAGNLRHQAQTIATALSDDLVRGKPDIGQLCHTLGTQTATRITIIRSDGVVLGESQGNIHVMSNHADRAEVQDALAGTIGQSWRFSGTLHQEMVYVAVPIKHNGSVVAIVRSSTPVRFVEQPYMRFKWLVIHYGIVVLLLAVLASYTLSYIISQPLKELCKGARRFVHGELSPELSISHSEEIGNLATVLNSMAKQLAHHAGVIACQQRELQMILSNMADGVIAIDMHAHITAINPAAAKILERSSEQASGMIIHEMIRSSSFYHLVERALAEDTPVQDMIALHDSAEHSLWMHAIRLHDVEGKPSGAVFFLTTLATHTDQGALSFKREPLMISADADNRI